MTIHVITPVYRPKDEWLFRCIESVQNQTCGPVTHTLVVDGNPDFQTPKGFTGRVIPCPSNHNDFGDTPRSIGIQSAIAAGASLIALLDDDNWFAPGHIERAIETQRQTGAALVASGRTMVDLDGDTMGVCARCGTREFADTSAMLYFPEIFPHLIVWEKLEPWMHAIGDRVVWNTLIDAGFEPGLTNAPTLNYRCTHAIHYEQFRRAVPDGVKQSNAVEVALDRWSRERGSSVWFVHDLIA